MQTKFFKRSEGVLAYSDYEADGELVLMLPGMGAMRSEYRYFKKYLRQLRDNLSESGRFDAVKRLGNSSRQPSDERFE